MLTKTSNTSQTHYLSEPYNAIRYKEAGEVLGAIISMGDTTSHATQKRLEKAKQYGYLVKNKLFNHQTLYAKNKKILIWIALIRSTMTYALRKTIKTIDLAKWNNFPLGAYSQYMPQTGM